MNKRTEHYAFMKESLEVMRKIDETTPKSVVHTLMYLMTEDVLLFDLQKQVTFRLFCQTDFFIASFYHISIDVSNDTVLSA